MRAEVGSATRAAMTATAMPPSTPRTSREADDRDREVGRLRCLRRAWRSISARRSSQSWSRPRRRPGRSQQPGPAWPRWTGADEVITTSAAAPASWTWTGRCLPRRRPSRPDRRRPHGKPAEPFPFPGIKPAWLSGFSEASRSIRVNGRNALYRTFRHWTGTETAAKQENMNPFVPSGRRHCPGTGGA
jgi:hypothetical protein